jgi:hypothetical protein
MGQDPRMSKKRVVHAMPGVDAVTGHQEPDRATGAVVNRFTGTTAPADPRWLGVTAIGGCIVFVTIMAALHFIQPELNPITTFGSHYAHGKMGWLMNLGTLAFATAVAALALAFARLPDSSRAGFILLGSSAFGLLIGGLVNVDPLGARPTPSGLVHLLAGLMTFLCMIPAAILLSRGLSFADRLRGWYRVLPGLSWLAALLFLANLSVLGALGLPGLGNRLFLAIMSAWLLTAGQGVRTNGFARLNPET